MGQTDNWPQYRGPSGDGQAAGADLPINIDESVVKWKTPVHGKGWSSPVVWGNQIWLTTATEDGKTMSVLCIDRNNGEILQDKVLIENQDPAFCHKMNSYATPTPVIQQGRVYVHFGSYLTACLDTSTGEVLWQRTDLPCDHHRGPASSPIIHAGKLFVAYDGFDVQYVVALDIVTGKTLWRRDRDIDYGTEDGDRMKAYCTGHVITVNGNEQLVYPSAAATIAYEIETGEPIWTVYHGGMNASARPLLGEGLLFLTNGSGAMVAVDPTGNGDVTDTHIKWTESQAVAKKSSQLLYEGLLFMISDDGIATCRNAKTGELFWKERLAGDYAASPILANGNIYAFSVDGRTYTIKASRDFIKLADGKLGDGCMASPAVVGNEMYVRSRTELFCLTKK